MPLTKSPSKSAMDSENEKERVNVLQDYHVWDADMHKELEGLVSLASNICGTPISLINLLDSHQQVTKANTGWNIQLMPRKSSFCQYTILGDELMIVDNAKEDERFNQSLFVQGEPNIHFYAGMPLKAKEGHNLGVLCVIDSEPRELSENQKQSLKLLASEVVSRLEFHKKQHELEEKNSTLKKIAVFLNNSSDIRAIIDPSTLKILEVNESAMSILGCKKSDLVGSEFGSRIVNKKVHQKIIRFLNQNKTTHASFISQVHNKSGEDKYLTHSFTRHDNLWFMTARDVTERQKARIELEKRSQAIKSSLDGIAILDEKGNITFMNEAHAAIYGYTKEELIGKPWEQLFNTKDHACFKHDADSLFDNKQQWRGEAEGIKKDGSKFPLEISLSKIKAGGLVSIVRDVSVRKRAQDHLKAEKKLTDKIIDSLPVIFFMINTDGCMVRWNTNLKESTGYSNAELPELYQTDFFPEDEKEKITAKIEELYKRGKSSVEADLKTKSGERIPFLFNTTLFESNGRKFMIGTGQNMSDQQQTQQKLIQSVEEKEVLLAEVHHRVKNNLAIISGLLELESFQAEDPSTERSLKHSQMRIQSMATIHELLYKANEFTNLPFKSFIAKIVHSIEATYHQPDKNISIEHTSDDITLNVNQAIPCALIINELVTNAYEHAFTDKKKGTIEIELSGYNKSIYLCVRDNGKGLPPDCDLEHPESLGIKLVGTLTKQLGADIFIEKESGTTVCLTFEKQDIKGSSSALLKH
jgi:PAS domain S-box-containing protein